jgi:hypothetical protein
VPWGCPRPRSAIGDVTVVLVFVVVGGFEVDQRERAWVGLIAGLIDP